MFTYPILKINQWKWSKPFSSTLLILFPDWAKGAFLWWLNSAPSLSLSHLWDVSNLLGWGDVGPHTPQSQCLYTTYWNFHILLTERQWILAFANTIVKRTWHWQKYDNIMYEANENKSVKSWAITWSPHSGPALAVGLHQRRHETTSVTEDNINLAWDITWSAPSLERETNPNFGTTPAIWKQKKWRVHVNCRASQYTGLRYWICDDLSVHCRNQN